jgi:hypothetical protein
MGKLVDKRFHREAVERILTERHHARGTALVTSENAVRTWGTGYGMGGGSSEPSTLYCPGALQNAPIAVSAR